VSWCRIVEIERPQHDAFDEKSDYEGSDYKIAVRSNQQNPIKAWDLAGTTTPAGTVPVFPK